MIEPTNYQSGYVASNSFMGELARIARDAEAALIVDEQSTCCGATGEGFWQYKKGEADYVVFGKRMQVSGYFSAERDGSRDVNLAGAQKGLRQFSVIKSHLTDRNIVEEVNKVGKAIASKVARSCEKSSKITGVRSVGTSSWIDTVD